MQRSERRVIYAQGFREAQAIARESHAAYISELQAFHRELALLRQEIAVIREWCRTGRPPDVAVH
jgi:hypothetical protein